jgi:YegS/Rv2252/BmrU family lipid kinase
MYHIILNPVAGKKKALENLEIVERILKERNLEYAVHQSAAERDAETIARELTTQGETELIVIGGDGTLHEVLNGIVDPTQCRLGLIPSGTGNDFAEKAGIAFDVETAVKNILDGQAQDTDYLEVGGVRCMNVAGFGIDVDVLERCKRGKMKGKPKYVLSLIQSLFSFKGISIEMQDGENRKEYCALIAAVCNGSQFGGGIKICPNAEINDGLIDVVLVDCMGKWKMIKAFLQLMKGKILQYPLTTYFRCERVHFTPDTPVTVQLDGELYQELDFDVKLCKGLHFYR